MAMFEMSSNETRVATAIERLLDALTRLVERTTALVDEARNEARNEKLKRPTK